MSSPRWTSPVATKSRAAARRWYQLGWADGGHAVVMDFSKYMNQILEVNTNEGWARVQPGVIQDEFNAHLRPLGFLFGPDTSTSNRATIGGMTGNNSAGSHSIVYGKTIDHVLELSIVLSDASSTVLKALDKAELEAKLNGGARENHIYRQVKRIVEANREAIQQRYPTIQRRVSGYNLDAFVRNGEFNLAKMVVASGGHSGHRHRSQGAHRAAPQSHRGMRGALRRSHCLHRGLRGDPRLRPLCHRDDRPHGHQLNARRR